VGYQKEERQAKEQVFVRQVELASVLEKGLEGVVDMEYALEKRKPTA